MHLQISRPPQHKEHGALYRAVAGTFQGFLAAMTRGWPRNGNRRGHVGNHLFILFTLIILGNQEVLMARKEPHFRSEKTSLHVDVPCSAAARAVAQLGFFSNLVGKLLAAFTLVGAAGFVAVLSEPTSCGAYTWLGAVSGPKVCELQLPHPELAASCRQMRASQDELWAANEG
jgi:hypothetical protein